MKEISASVLGVLLFLPYEGTESPVSMVARVDVSAILRSWRIKGVMVCSHKGRPRTCLWVENAYPCGILEVVRRPFASHLSVPLPKIGGALTSSGGTDRGQTNLQFGEARVFTFIPPLPDELEIPIARPRGPFFAVNYMSELDAWGWRTGLMDRVLRAPASIAPCDLAPDPARCAGTWGSYYPREGFLVHQSEPMASLVQALRAGRVANDPAGRFALVPYPFEPRTGHFIQMIRPALRPAIRIGQLGPVDAGAGSLYGAYLYIHLGIFEECRRCLPPRLVGVR
ncbi:MAG: TraU family protein [Planctomycetes bacterium]|nr:TraU family protein [Planctomycetota bacterium]